MDYLTLHDIVAATLPEDDLEVPEWGGWVHVRAITMAEMNRARRLATDQRTKYIDEIELAARIVEVGCLEPRFNPNQFKLVMDRIAGAGTRISNRILELSGLGTEEEPKQTEDGEQGEA